MFRKMTLAALFAFALGLPQAVVAGETGSAPSGQSISMNLAGCQTVSDAYEALKWTYIDKATYDSCKADSDCTTSWNFGACGGVLNTTSARILDNDFAKSCEFARLQDLENRYLCPKPACAAAPFVRCQNQRCVYAFSQKP